MLHLMWLQRKVFGKGAGEPRHCGKQKAVETKQCDCWWDHAETDGGFENEALDVVVGVMKGKEQGNTILVSSGGVGSKNRTVRDKGHMGEWATTITGEWLSSSKGGGGSEEQRVCKVMQDWGVEEMMIWIGGRTAGTSGVSVMGPGQNATRTAARPGRFNSPSLQAVGKAVQTGIVGASALEVEAVPVGPHKVRDPALVQSS